MAFNKCILIYMTIFTSIVYGSRPWTEVDEARRIQQLKEAEHAEFLKEQEAQSLDNRDYPYYDHYVPYRRPRPMYAAQQLTSTIKPTFEIIPNVADEEENWCYQCATPLSVVDRELTKVITQLLKMRRASYPYAAVNPECTNPTNRTKLAKQQCRHSYCATIVLTDHETMNIFTMRGCAEFFGAIDKETLRNRPDNSCERLTDKVDLQECICEKRKYCYTGPQRIFSFETYEIPAISSNTKLVKWNSLLLFLTLSLVLL